MQKIHLPGKTTIVLAVLIIMTVTVVVLRLKIAITGPQEVPDTRQSLNTLLNRAIPSDEEIQQLFLQSLGTEPLRSAERRMTSPDSSVLVTQLSKPEGTARFPSVILVHDLPTSTKATTALSSTLGEDLSTVTRSVVSVIDYSEFRQPSDMVRDVYTAIQYQEKFRETVNEPVFLVGIGGGSLPVLQAAVNADIAQKIDGVILINGYHSPTSVWEQLQTQDPLEARFFVQYFDCDAQFGAVSTTELSTEERERIARCLDEYEVSGTVKDIPVLSIRTKNNIISTDAVHEGLKTVLSGTRIDESVIETADTSGAIFVTATSPEFLKARAVMSEWIETVSQSTATRSSDNTTNANTTTPPSIETENNAEAVSAPIIVE